eukprot:252387_1
MTHRCRWMDKAQTRDKAEIHAPSIGLQLKIIIGDGDCYNGGISYDLTGTVDYKDLVKIDLIRVYKNKYNVLLKYFTERQLRSKIPIAYVTEGVPTAKCLEEYVKVIEKDKAWMGSDLDIVVTEKLYWVDIGVFNYILDQDEVFMMSHSLVDKEKKDNPQEKKRKQNVYLFSTTVSGLHPSLGFQPYIHYDSYYNPCESFVWSPISNELNRDSMLIKAFKS